jgi:hypothetical protein
LVAAYGSRLPDQAAPQPLQTLVSCEQRSSERWSCDEDDIDAYAKSIGTAVQRTEDGRLILEALDALLGAVLDQGKAGEAQPPNTLHRPAAAGIEVAEQRAGAVNRRAALSVERRGASSAAPRGSLAGYGRNQDQLNGRRSR